jgi:hypothetical protein
MVMSVLREGAPPGYWGISPLMAAVMFEEKDIVNVLLTESVVNVNKTDNEGRTAIFWTITWFEDI